MFCILFLYSIDNSRLGILQSKHRSALTKLGSKSISPENLPGAAKTFEVRIPVEDREFPVERMIKLKAWEELNDTLSAYAKRIELMQEQNEELNDRLQRRATWTSWSALAMISLSFVFGLWQRRAAAQEAKNGSQTGMETVPGE